MTVGLERRCTEPLWLERGGHLSACLPPAAPKRWRPAASRPARSNACGVLVTYPCFEKPQESAEIRKFDEYDYPYRVGRPQDMVVSCRFNVFMAEVEAAVTELPQMREAVLFGIPHEKRGEMVHASVAGEGITAEEIIAYTKQRRGGVQAPKSIEFGDSILRTAAGKMDKKELRKKSWGDAQHMVN